MQRTRISITLARYILSAVTLTAFFSSFKCVGLILVSAMYFKWILKWAHIKTHNYLSCSAMVSFKLLPFNISLSDLIHCCALLIFLSFLSLLFLICPLVDLCFHTLIKHQTDSLSRHLFPIKHQPQYIYKPQPSFVPSQRVYAVSASQQLLFFWLTFCMTSCIFFETACLCLFDGLSKNNLTLTM